MRSTSESNATIALPSAPKKQVCSMCSKMCAIFFMH